ncbi:MAG: hypothetical protein KGL39_13320 [Patescibacteria group bacterium]|nr:hypothetical protein [Patescibacteria group bacterium]
MAWRPITTTQVLAEFTPQETAALNAIQGVATALNQILTDTVGEFVGAMNAAGYAVNTDGTIPDQLRRQVIARARWGWLISFPQLKSLQTDGRKKAADDAAAMLEKVAARQAGALEDPSGTVPSNANWNSENRLILRTHPAPPASSQAPPQTGGAPYANPAAPADL